MKAVLTTYLRLTVAVTVEVIVLNVDDQVQCPLD